MRETKTTTTIVCDWCDSEMTQWYAQTKPRRNRGAYLFFCGRTAEPGKDFVFDVCDLCFKKEVEELLSIFPLQKKKERGD